MADERYLTDLITDAARRLGVPRDRVRFTFEFENDGYDCFTLYAVVGLLDTQGRLVEIAASSTPSDAVDRLVEKAGPR